MKAFLFCLLGNILISPGLKAQSGFPVRPVHIGQSCPDVLMQPVLNFKTPSVRISDFRGKLLILDFWATWCGACIAEMPAADSLQKEFKGRIQFLPVDYEKLHPVQSFLKAYQLRMHIQFPTVVGDTILVRMFPHQELPHFVWIDTSGVVCAITGVEQINAHNIAAMLKGRISLAVKKDYRVPLDQSRPFLLAGNGGDGSNLIYHSLLTGFTPGIHPFSRLYPRDSIHGRRMLLVNADIRWLLAYAFCDDSANYMPLNRCEMDVQDSSLFFTRATGPDFLQWAQGRTFSYELIVPPGMEKDFYPIARRDMLDYFGDKYGVSASIQPRTRKCWSLVRTSATDKIRTRGGSPLARFSQVEGARLRNEPLDYLIAELETVFMQHSPMPLINHTGDTENVDMDLNADLSSMTSLNKALAPYDLRFEPAEQQIHVLVITQKNPNGNTRE